MRNRDFIFEAEKFNISEIGFISAKEYNHLFDKKYKSIVVALFPYYCGGDENSNISLYTRGKDYHIVVKEIFLKIFHNLNIPEFEIFSDIGPEIDRELAYKAGLGFIGISNMLINKKYGSYCFIGYVLCNEEFQYSKPVTDTCMKCMKCVSHCPGNAILDSGEFVVEKCLSDISQRKGKLTSEEIEKIVQSGCVFGCDICQKICPHNQKILHSEISEFTDNLIDGIYLSDLKNLSNKEFKVKFGDRAFSWRGKALLERNLKYFGDLYEHNNTER